MFQSAKEESIMGRCIMKRIGSFALSVVLVFASVNTTAVAQNNDSKAIGSNYSKEKGWNVQYNPRLPVDECVCGFLDIYGRCIVCNLLSV